MMTEIALNILDVTENSVRAGASYIEISVIANTEKDILEVSVTDNGCGMNEGTEKLMQKILMEKHTLDLAGTGIGIQNVVTRLRKGPKRTVANKKK